MPRLAPEPPPKPRSKRIYLMWGVALAALVAAIIVIGLLVSPLRWAWAAKR